VAELRIRQAQDVAALEAWRHIHNVIVPADPLSSADVAHRAERNLLDVAYLGDAAVGCSTIRPPEGPGGTATVIARILPEQRRHGYGAAVHLAALARARALSPGEIETIVWAANTDGLRFAERNGYVEVERYTLDGQDVPYVTLRLCAPA
jgi:RimJ/RimL family protein N-acetyltransferase